MKKLNEIYQDEFTRKAIAMAFAMTSKAGALIIAISLGLYVFIGLLVALTDASTFIDNALIPIIISVDIVVFIYFWRETNKKRLSSEQTGTQKQ